MRDHHAVAAAIASREFMPFAWGGNDCVFFAAAIVAAQTGVDPLAGLKWKTKERAVRVAAAQGGLEVAMDARFARIAPAFAQRGDIAGIADEAFGVRLMIVEGATLAGPGDNGVKRLPREAMTMAWSIG